MNAPIAARRPREWIDDDQSFNNRFSMTVTCTQCQATTGLRKLRQPVRFSFGLIILGILGGAIGAVFRALGQDGKFECSQCRHIFYSPTTVSLVFFGLCLLVYSLVAVAICYGLWTTFISAR